MAELKGFYWLKYIDFAKELLNLDELNIVILLFYELQLNTDAIVIASSVFISNLKQNYCEKPLLDCICSGVI